MGVPLELDNVDLPIEEINSEEMMEQNKVIVHFKGGKILKGVTSDFLPNKTEFHISDLNGKMENIEVSRLKAVFFVKDMAGDGNHEYSYEDVVVAGGRKIKVEFSDGETIVGYTLSYTPDRQGFFITPADFQGNNERIFIVKAATTNVTFL